MRTRLSTISATAVCVALLGIIGPAAQSQNVAAPQPEALIAVARPTFDSAHITANGWVDEGDRHRRQDQVEEVRKGDTLMTVLGRLGVPNNQAHEAVSSLRSVFNPRDLKPGQELKVTLLPGQGEEPARFAGLSFQASIERDVHVRLASGGDGYSAHEVMRPLKQSLGQASAVIESSIFTDGTAAGVPVEVMMELIKAFSYDVDFQREIQPGDRMDVVFEQTHDVQTGKLARTGKMLYAALTLSGNKLELYWHVPRDGSGDYFNNKGESTRKALLRTPIDGAKLTSSFGMRNHPILGYSVMHKGVDFGAVTGTPIQAAGDGTVAFAGDKGAYGNYVQLRHTGQYSTAYAHMSRFATGLKPGQRVRQGQIIGYVGSTGRSTGAHLHYEVLVNGAQINPLSVKLPTGRKLDGRDMRDFEIIKASIEKQFRVLPDPAQMASNDNPKK